MTPEQEDALYAKFMEQCEETQNFRESFRLAIRAAVAQEREWCARIALDPDYSPEGIAAAIRRGAQ